ncbi:Gfo/Idh/MocA family protein [Pacificimonas flava]|uniref:L-arabinose 1-dehydrogenase n=1 Tax=Pacificimonas flava TaxID=1234595 RepID=M2T8N2_9SPHN|nr:Gfo/Idh/MocA family oxidoreductase [Pacificimonas flava]EMD82844.1 L-arabinose 1-dehydrogenase [Pacificimonas flava]MBB5279459.1 D-galactose 1-dehydrogenase/L-arabinose 1- dehydrogenase [Pacificimonas flava]
MSEASARPIRLGLVGIGKIARDQHIPAINASPDFELAATASRSASVDGVPGYRTIEEMLAAGHDLDAVSFCTPPVGRHDLVSPAIAAGLAVMIEKPPAATLSEARAMTRAAEIAGIPFYTSWHSRAARHVEDARSWCAERQVSRIHVEWREDIRQWHPGQEWILEAGGFGVFDPGINALSILTAILPKSVVLSAATLDVPRGRGAPIAATLQGTSGDAAFSADFDFLQTGEQTWSIHLEDAAGETLSLIEGAGAMTLGGERQPASEDSGEYPHLYAHFATLVREGRSDVDLSPLELVADAFLLGEHRATEPFSF